MRISAAAMNAALSDLQSLQYQSQVSAAYEALLTAKWFEGDHSSGDRATFSAIGGAVSELFELLPGNPLGRLRPFKWDWAVAADSGRKTVWNNNSRAGNRKSQQLFVGGHIGSGLTPTAVVDLANLLPVDASGAPRVPKRQALAVLVLHADDFNAEATWATADARLRARLNLTDAELAQITSATTLGVDLIGQSEWSVDTLDPALVPQDVVVIQPSAGPLRPVQAETDLAVVIDGRLERMLRIGLRSFASIMLVGPPGTGKDTILRWLIHQAQREPNGFGFTEPFDPNPMWRTPDESWTAFELIGGLAPDRDSQLAWSPGLLLNALAENRWLILDETNRGDMDKIMGPLLTWLSEQEVEIGRTRPHDGKPITIGWSTHAASSFVDTSESIRYLAGSDWRLIGTYNPQDAQRVFRFGQALSRRFIVIPVPALQPGQFEQLLTRRFPHLPAQAVQALIGLYSAHQVDAPTMLGPALFLGMARYLQSGLPAFAGDGTDSEGTESLMLQLLAESYVLATARYLAGYDDRVVDALGRRIVDHEGVLTDSQWAWVMRQRDIVS